VTVTFLPAATALGVEPSSIPTPTALRPAARTPAPARLHRALGGVHDLQHVEHVERVVADLDARTALIAEHDRALTAGPAASARSRPPLLLDVGVGGDQHHADAAGGRHGELLRLDPLAVRRTPRP
jgi:hypothetical protein